MLEVKQHQKDTVKLLLKCVLNKNNLNDDIFYLSLW